MKVLSGINSNFTGVFNRCSTTFFAGKNRLLKVFRTEINYNVVFFVVCFRIGQRSGAHLYKKKRKWEVERELDSLIGAVPRECFTCKRVEAFVLQNRAPLDSAACNICLNETQGQKIVYHPTDGEKHPLHRSCFIDWVLSQNPV